MITKLTIDVHSKEWLKDDQLVELGMLIKDYYASRNIKTHIDMDQDVDRNWAGTEEQLTFTTLFGPEGDTDNNQDWGD